MASRHRRTVRWTTQGGHQRTDRAAGKETLWTCATGWDAFRSPLRSPQLPGSAPARCWHHEVTTWLQSQSDGRTAA
jgi:hypothetical protein